MSINPRILGAVGVGATLIAFAYFFAPEPIPTATNTTDPLTAPVLREFIEVGDSDNDGVPDWSESFRQATVPVIEKEELEGAGQAYEPPESLTGQLAIDMFTKMIEGETHGPLGPSQEDILKSTDQRMREAATDTLFELSTLTITDDNDIESLHAYGNRVAEILVTYIPGSEVRNEVDIIQHAAQTQNPDIIEELNPIIEGYTEIVSHFTSMSVPSSVAQDHLNMLNAFNAVRIDIEGMKMAFSDPIYTVVRMQRYYDDVLGRNNAIMNVYYTLDSEGVVWKQSDIVTQLISF